ncbi:DNA primase [Desulfurivibrio sp. C05AmB]|uniref:DNA primase n=1 Tax=Desulfurivibrio sp. C05AmB TaxID=3374371 RepID=UPI00376F2870
MAVHHDDQLPDQRREVVRRIKETADITEIIGEYVNLQRSGANLKGLCPFHAEKTPSFMVSPARGSFHCFGCGEGGDVLSFLMLYHRISFPEALKQLAARYHITLAETTLSPRQREEARKRESLYAVNARAAALYRHFLLNDPAAAAARAYLARRGMTTEVGELFQLGYAPPRWDFLGNILQREGVSPAIAAEAGLLVARDGGTPREGQASDRDRGYYDRFRDRIIFPIVDLTGRISGFGGRILGEGEPKYLNTPETPIFSKGQTLFGLYQHRDALRKARSCLLVEGNFDLLALAAHQVHEAVAPLGTALTADQLRILRGYVDEAILLFDGDSAGLKAAMRAVPLFLAEKLTGRVVILPPGHDPDSFVREHGKQGLSELLAGAQALPEFIFDQLAARHGLGVDGKNRIIAELAPITQALGDQLLLRTRFIAHFSERLGISSEQFCQSLGPASRRPPLRGQAGPNAAPGSATRLKLSPNEEKIFAFIFFHGRFLDDFLAAGLAEVAVSPAARALLELVTSHAAEFSRAPETLLEEADPLLRPLVSSLLINGGDLYPQDRQEESALELLAWLRQHGHRRNCDQLNREISAAYQAGDQERLLELMKQKQALSGAGGG